MGFYYYFKDWQSYSHDDYFDYVFANVERIYKGNNVYNGDDEHWKFGDLSTAKERLELLPLAAREHYKNLIKMIEDNPDTEMTCG